MGSKVSACSIKAQCCIDDTDQSEQSTDSVQGPAGHRRWRKTVTQTLLSGHSRREAKQQHKAHGVSDLIHSHCRQPSLCIMCALTNQTRKKRGDLCVADDTTYMCYCLHHGMVRVVAMSPYLVETAVEMPRDNMKHMALVV